MSGEHLSAPAAATMSLGQITLAVFELASTGTSGPIMSEPDVV
jgi:hypothetical protein